MNNWSEREAQLWNTMHSPGRRRVTAHSKNLPPGSKARKEFDKALMKARAAEFAAGWRAYGEWVNH
jgi:hypothetical protein